MLTERQYKEKIYTDLCTNLMGMFDDNASDSLMEAARLALLALVDKKYESGDFECYTFATPVETGILKGIETLDIDDLMSDDCECMEEDPDQCLFGNTPCSRCDKECCGQAGKGKNRRIKEEPQPQPQPVAEDKDNIDDIYKALEKAYRDSDMTLDWLKSKEPKKEEKVEPKSTFYTCSMKYNPENGTYDFYINDNGTTKEESIIADCFKKANLADIQKMVDDYEAHFNNEQTKVKELEKKNIHPWDLGDICSFFR